MARFLGKLSTESHSETLEELKLGSYILPSPTLADDDLILEAQALDEDDPIDVTEFDGQPESARTITVKPSLTQLTNKFTVYGTDISGAELIEEVSFNAAAEVETVNAFRTITRIHFPKRNAGAATVKVGVGASFGLPYKISNPAQVFAKFFDGSTDAGTLSADGEVLAKNLYSPAGTLDGDKQVELWLIV